MNNNISNSASKIVFIILTVTICLAFMIEVVKGTVTFEAKDFVPLVAMAFVFYFTKPASDSGLPGASK